MLRLAAVILLSILAAAEAAAQPADGGSGPPPVVAQSKIQLTLEERHVIREVLKENPGKPPPADVSIEIGATVPQNVATLPFPQIVRDKVPQMRPYAYFVKGGEIVVVDPKEGRVLDVIN